MMKVLFKSLALTAAFILITDVVMAQKIGYVNSGLLVNELPEMKALQSELEAFQTQLKKKGEGEVAKFQLKEKEAVDLKKRGEMTPKMEETAMAELQKMQEDIYAMGADMEKQLADKQNEGMAPILEKVNNAIKAVADEGGYTYILDTQAGVILYADENADVTALVKTKLSL